MSLAAVAAATGATAAAPPPVPPARSLHEDPLALALVWLTRHHGRERSVDALCAALPASARVDASLALRMLGEAGLHATLVERPLAEVHELLLPAVLLLDDGGAWIATARREGEPPRYDIVMPGAVELRAVVSEAEVQARHDGRVLLATPALAEGGDEPPLAGPGEHWLWGTMRRFAPYYRSAMLAALLSNVLMLVTGLATSVIFDKVIPHQAFVTLWAVALAGGLALGFDLLARQLRAYLIDLAGRKADLLVGAALFRHTLGIRMEHRPASAGAYSHQLAQVEMVRDFFASATLSALSDLPFIVLFIAATFLIAGPLGWVLVAAVPLILGVAMLIQASLRRNMSAHMHQQADLQGVLVEAVDGIEDLKAAGAQGRFVRLFEHSTAAAADSALRSRATTSWIINASMVAQQAVTLVFLVWGVYLIADRQLTNGALMAGMMFAGRAIGPLQSVVMLAMRWQAARAATRALDGIMRQPTERDAARHYVPRLAFSGRVGLNDVGFAYPAVDGQATPRVLQHVTLRFQAGERAAILGRIGSGKSTILRLLAGLYQPLEGQVEVDGIDLRQVDPADYRARVGFVSQDPRLFTGTLRDNVLLDRSAADPTRLAEVAALTGLDRLVAAHPLGWDLPVGEAGALLSGGQRQRVALARCLVTRPRILLMDEPTSSMDAQSEQAFLRRLAAAAGDCTLIVVTHRPALLDLVQRIVVVDGGRPVMDGPRDAVLSALAGPADKADKAGSGRAGAGQGVSA